MGDAPGLVTDAQEVERAGHFAQVVRKIFAGKPQVEVYRVGLADVFAGGLAGQGGGLGVVVERR